VFGTFQDNSLKSSTREDRGMGVRVEFDEEDLLNNYGRDWLQNDEN
jgi:hypothetical protein